MDAKAAAIKAKTRESAALTSLQEAEIKAAEDPQKHLRKDVEDQLILAPADARERKAVAAAAALKVLLKEEDQKSNIQKTFLVQFSRSRRIAYFTA